MSAAPASAPGVLAGGESSTQLIEIIGRLQSDNEVMAGRLRTVGLAAKVGIWEYDFEQESLWVSDELAAIYGLGPTMTWADFISRIHPDDMDTRLERPTPSLPFGELNQFLIRVRHADGEYRTIRSRSVTIGSGDTPHKKVGAHIDVSEDEAMLVNGELAEANERLRQFSHLASHDLRSPLRGIRHLVSFIDEDHGETLPPEVMRMMSQIAQRAGQMDRLVEDLLRYSTGSLRQVMVEHCDVNRLVFDIARLVEPRGCSLNTSTTVDGHVSVAASPLTICIRNLIDNACKHHDKVGGTVDASVVLEADTLVVVIADDGPGLSDGVAERMFEPFFTTKSQDGSGIGLAHVARTAEQYGADLSYETVAGRGTTFTLRWPTKSSVVAAST